MSIMNKASYYSDWQKYHNFLPGRCDKYYLPYIRSLIFNFACSAGFYFNEYHMIATFIHINYRGKTCQKLHLQNKSA